MSLISESSLQTELDALLNRIGTREFIWNDTKTLFQDLKDSRERYLGLPSANGQVLASQLDGTRSWVTVGTGSGSVTSVNGGGTGLSFTTATTTPTMIGVLNVVNGGSGLPTATTGGIRYASATNTLSELAIGTTGKYLTSNGTIPQWSTNTFTADVQGIGDARYISLAGSETISRTALYSTGNINIGRSAKQNVQIVGTSLNLVNEVNTGSANDLKSYVILDPAKATLYAFNSNTSSGNARSLEVNSGNPFVLYGQDARYFADYSGSFVSNSLINLGYADAKYTQLLKTFKTITVNSVATETDLQSYTIPANTLADGETIEFTSSITAAGSGGQYNIYLKNINYYGVGLIAGNRITSIVRMTRDGTNANYSITVTGDVLSVQNGTITFDATVANINKVTGQGTSTNDLTAYIGNVIKLPFK